MTSILDRDFGSDEDSDGEDFNPAAHVESDDEDIRKPSRDNRKSSSKHGQDIPEDEEEGDDQDDGDDAGEDAGSDDEGAPRIKDEDEDEDDEDEDDEEDEDVRLLSMVLGFPSAY
jgi:hypothetical protein